jgi:hypothetical protein
VEQLSQGAFTVLALKFVAARTKVRREEAGRQAGTSRATKLSLCCCCILWSVVCVFMASRAASITCCSLLLIEGGAWPGHRAFLYTYMDLFSAQRAARGGMKKAQSMRAQRPAGALFSPLLGKGVD